MGNEAKRNIQTILTTRATASLEAEVQAELITDTPEVSVASLVTTNAGPNIEADEGDRSEEHNEATSLRDQSSTSDEREDQDPSDDGDDEDQ